jgi:hypothetical protein
MNGYVNGLELHKRGMPCGALEQLSAILDAHGRNERLVCVDITDNTWRAQGATLAVIAVTDGANRRCLDALAKRQAEYAAKLGLRAVLVGAPRKALAPAVQELFDMIVY